MRYLLITEATALALYRHLERDYIPTSDDGMLVKAFLRDVDRCALRTVERPWTLDLTVLPTNGATPGGDS